MFGKSKNAAHTTETRTKVGTLIGEGAIFNGNLSAPEAVRVDGTVNGNFTCEKELIIGPAGQIKGNISAQNVVISGTVNGDISVSGKLEILSTGKLKGNITAKSLVVDEDACFDGRCTMTTSGQVVDSNNTADASQPQETQNTAPSQQDTYSEQEKSYLSQPKDSQKSYTSQAGTKSFGSQYAKDTAKSAASNSMARNSSAE